MGLPVIAGKRRIPARVATDMGLAQADPRFREPFPQASRDELMDRAGFSAAGLAERVRLAQTEDGRIYLFRAAGAED